MASTVEKGFEVFLGWLTPSEQESDAAKSHRASIRSCLDSNLGVVTFFRTGSFGNGTSIRWYSDVDYFAWLSMDNVQWSLRQDSGYVLQLVCNALDRQFPRTGVYIDAPAIVVPFGTNSSETTEIVPAEFEDRRIDGKYVYRIANGSGGWLRSSPEVHNTYVREIDARLGGKVEPLVRFLKAWNFYNDVKISSFYLEMFTVQYANTQQIIIYDIDLLHCLSRLYSEGYGLYSIEDPEGISGQISPGLTDYARQSALAALREAVLLANDAYEARKRGDVSAAFAYWDRLFKGRFPNYTS